MEVIVINGTKRSSSGTTAATSVRNAGLTPCIMYGGNETVSFSATPAELRKLVYTSKFKIAEVKIDGKTHKCILKAIQFHPTSDAVLHVDLLELIPGKKFKANLPIRYEGQSIGVKNGGKFLSSLRSVSVLTTPEKLVDEVVADITTLDLGQTIRVRDIQPIDGLTVINNSAIPIAIIEIPRALRGKK
jgi:large subunit ribosomal protein L25